jgi:histidinol-phosphate aminotransferase
VKKKNFTNNFTKPQKRKKNPKMDPTEYLRSDLTSLEKYLPIKPLEVLADEIGLPVNQLVKLDANENLYGPIPEIKEAILNSNLHIYPDPSQNYLRKALSHYLNVPPSHIIAGSGSDDVIDIIIRLVDPKVILISTPTFGMYSFLGKINKANICDVPRTSSPHFDIDFPAIEQAVSKMTCERKAVLMFFASPNNPTGRTLTHEQIDQLCSLGASVVVDEAYAEFCEPSFKSGVELTSKYPNLLVLRTFSKWAALAGLRVGYGVGNPTLIEWMMACKQPYNVNAAADVAAQAALQHIDKVLVTVNLIKDEKIRLLEQLSQFTWLTPIPSSANFYLVHVTGPVDAGHVATALRKVGVLIRYFSTPILKDYIRISIGKPSDTDAIITALKEIEFVWKILDDYVPEAVIFDMDGVLADVSLSYRQAILSTAKAFGADITSSDIADAKAAGNANNDWILTHRLVQNFFAKKSSGGGPVPTLDEVTRKFEDIYQGLPGVPGLRELEKLLVDMEVLQMFYSHLPLAIVTGRPRSDAIKFLETHKISHFFKHVVCMEDAPAKPDPAPVRLALQQLGVKRALMIGDTPDDIKAAVAAGIVGVGILSPGDKAGEHALKIRTALLGSKAARIIDHVHELVHIAARQSKLKTGKE